MQRSTLPFGYYLIRELQPLAIAAGVIWLAWHALAWALGDFSLPTLYR